MKKPYKTHNDELIDTSGCSFVDCINATYADLVATFGEPIRDDVERKTDVEWHVKFHDGTRATIYNWKNGPSWCGPDVGPVEEIINWNVGGHSRRAALPVVTALSAKQVMQARNGYTLKDLAARAELTAEFGDRGWQYKDLKEVDDLWQKWGSAYLLEKMQAVIAFRRGGYDMANHHRTNRTSGPDGGPAYAIMGDSQNYDITQPLDD